MPTRDVSWSPTTMAAETEQSALNTMLDDRDCDSTSNTEDIVTANCHMLLTFPTTTSNSNHNQELLLLPRSGPDDWARWEAGRARGPGWRPACGTGNAPGTHASLKQWNHLTMVCCKLGCSALVDYKAARREALRAGRSSFKPGDGCGARSCSRSHRPARFTSRQVAMAAMLKGGKRLLARWPRDRADRDVWVHGQEATDAAAAAVCAAASSCASSHSHGP